MPMLNHTPHSYLYLFQSGNWLLDSVSTQSSQLNSVFPHLFLTNPAQAYNHHSSINSTHLLNHPHSSYNLSDSLTNPHLYIIKFIDLFSSLVLIFLFTFRHKPEKFIRFIYLKFLDSGIQPGLILIGRYIFTSLFHTIQTRVESQNSSFMNSEIEFRDENLYTREYRPGNTFMITMGEEEASREREEESFTAYKRVDKKVKPVPGIFPEDARVI